MARQVYITGIGAVTSFGVGVEALWDACKQGRSVIEPVPAEWANYYQSTSDIWAPLPVFDFRALGFTKAEILAKNIPSLLALRASAEACKQADVTRNESRADPYRRGVFAGTGLGGAQAPFDNYRAHLLAKLLPHLANGALSEEALAQTEEHQAALKAHPRVNPLVICQTMPNAVAAEISIATGFRGAAETLCYACASGTVAIGRAFQSIQSGELDLAIAIGVEHLRDRAGGVFMGFDRLQTLAKPRADGAANRPFDRERTGFLFSEGGAGALILESAESAYARGAIPCAEIVSFAVNSDAFSMVAMTDEHSSVPRLFQKALEMAGLGAEKIGYINAHGTSTELNDRVEARLLKQVFGQGPIVNSTKSILGHTIGASGALEAIVTVRSLQEQLVHGSLNLVDPIEELNFAYSTTASQFEYALSESFGFGGHNAALILKRI